MEDINVYGLSYCPKSSNKTDIFSVCLPVERAKGRETFNSGQIRKIDPPPE